MAKWNKIALLFNNTNMERWERLPECPVMLSRIARNRVLYALPEYSSSGRPPKYGERMKKPAQYLKERQGWQTARVMVEREECQIRYRLEGPCLLERLPEQPMFLLVVRGMVRKVKERRVRQKPAFYLVPALRQGMRWVLPVPVEELLAWIWQRMEEERKTSSIAEEPAIQLRKPPLLTKVKEPLIQPRIENEWECYQTFNSSAILLDGKVHFLYRAIGKDGISRFGYANSKDGFHLEERLNSPVYEHIEERLDYSVYQHEVRQAFFYSSGGSFAGAEDPRIVRVGDEDVVYMTYTAFTSYPRVALTSIKLSDFLEKRWSWSKPKLISPPGQIHKNWVIFPEKINNKYAILHSITPKISISFLDDLEFDTPLFIESYYNGLPIGQWKNGWEDVVKGVGPPPIKTRYGWLVLYHAFPKNGLGGYNIGALLLDIENPTTMLCRTREPILDSLDSSDVLGGVKPGVVYTTGAVVKDDKLLIYYGASDTVVRVAYANIEQFLDSLMERK